MLSSVYWKKESPTISELFRDCVNPMLLVLAGDQTVIRYSENLKDYELIHDTGMDEEGKLYNGTSDSK